MSAGKRFSLRRFIRNMGVRSVLASTLVFLLTVAATCAGGYLYYQSTRDDIYLQGELNVVEAARAFDNYLLVRMNTVDLAAHVVDEMLREGIPNGEILEYLTAQSQSIKKSIDKDYTGLYGWINGEYCDGDGWVPDEGYVPTERPWYTQTVAGDDGITFVKPYLDDQTKTVLTTIAKRLSDGVSVVALDVTLSRIQEITGEIARHTALSYGLVLDGTGRVIAHSDPAELGKDYLEEEGTLGAVLAARVFDGGDDPFELRYGDQKYMVFTERIEGDWRAVSLINTRVFYRPLFITLSLLALFTLLEAAVFVVILYNQSAKNHALASAEAAESASRAKSQFLSRMSHEIRTPINAIIGLDSIALRDGNLSQHTRDELTKIGASAQHLLAIINDILDMSRIESGCMALKEEVFCLDGLLEQICIIVESQCRDKGLGFHFRREAPLDAWWMGDSLKLKQVLINILGNSVKFTDAPGDITFTVRQEESPGERAALCFTMADTGIGMDPSFIPRLFEPFSQEDTGNTTRFGGSGLGMAITRSMVDMMGGTVEVQSEKGKGTAFKVTVTLGKAEAPQAPAVEAEAAHAPSLEGRHLLIAEDQEMNAEVLTDLLELEDMTSEWARDGRKAVEMLSRSAPGHFDAILMDMRMPVMDGLEATRAIRALDRPDAAGIPIIALSANAFEEDVRQCLAAGMNAHLAKPVDIERLKATLASLL